MNKQHIPLIILLLESMIFLGYYVFGSEGVLLLKKLQEQSAALQLHVNTLKSEIGELEAYVTQWESDSFFKERIAREQLQMAYCDEKIYIV